MHTASGPGTPAGDPAYRDLTAEAHPDCIACSPTHEAGLHLEYDRHDDGSVEAQFECRRSCSGYSGRVHGGIVALLLDSAMTHCLFAQHCTAYTARLSVRYRRPVLTDRSAVVRACLLRKAHGLFRLRAELEQENRLCASAQATFVAAPPARRQGGRP